MTTSRELRSYDYVNHPYARVRDVLRADAPGIFRRATTAAAARAQSLAASLKVQVGPIEVSADIDVKVKSVDEHPDSFGSPVTKIELEWQAVRAPGLFPTMEATLAVYPLSGGETQLDLHGRYQPPLGAVGAALDSLVGHRIAEASVLRLVQEVAGLLRAQLT
jgi:hypothetical protein